MQGSPRKQAETLEPPRPCEVLVLGMLEVEKWGGDFPLMRMNSWGPSSSSLEQTGRGVSVNPTGGSPALYLLTAPQPLRSGYLLIGIDGVH